MAAVNSAVIVQLVDNDIAQVFEKPRPLGMVRQDSAVQHVRVGEHHVGPLPDGAARILRGIAVISEGADFRAHLFDGLLEFVELILGQRLGGKQVHGARAFVGGQQVQDRQVVTERLAAGGWSYDHHVLRGLNPLERFRLVRVQSRDAAFFQSGAQPRIHRRRNLRPSSLRRRLVVNSADRRIRHLVGRAEKRNYGFQRLFRRQLKWDRPPGLSLRQMPFVIGQDVFVPQRQATRPVLLGLGRRRRAHAHKFVALERGGDLEYPAFIVCCLQAVGAKYFPHAAQVHGLASFVIQRDYVLDCAAQFGFALGSE